jgi:MFS transporter, AAHS family, benzoate transport protein
MDVAGSSVGPRDGWVAPLCWMAVALEGYDLVVLGVVIPSLLKYPAWDLTPSTATTISVVGLIGVMVGAMTVGAVTDIIGRRKTMLASVIAFSIFTLLCAFAPSPWTFGLLRILAGLGLGGVLPTALALVNEYARIGRGGQATTTMMTGYHVGGVVSALLGILTIEHLGWRWMFVFGAIPALLLVPVMAKWLPESASFLEAARVKGSTSKSAQPAGSGKQAVSTLFHHGLLRPTIAFWVTCFMGLLLVYGLNTWLPQIMRAAGYDLGAALALLLVLNAGGVLGLLVAGRVADTIGNKRSTVIWFVGATLALAALSIKLPGATVYVTVLLAGIFVFSAQVLVYAYISRVYPVTSRGTALGAASGVGRLGAISGPTLGGALLAAGLAYPWGFYAFAAVAAIGAAAISLVNYAPRPDEPLPVTEDEVLRQAEGAGS